MIDLRFRPMGPLAKRPRVEGRFKANYSDTLNLLEAELARINAKNIIIEAGYELPQIRNDGWPKSSARPSHPDVRLSFSSKGNPMAFPCATYTRIDDNLRAIALTLEALRAINRYGVTQEDQQYRGFTALPEPEAAGMDKTKAATLLAFLAGQGHASGNIMADPEAREAAYKIVAKKTHPDLGGNRETWDKVQEAIGVLRG